MPRSPGQHTADHCHLPRLPFSCDVSWPYPVPLLHFGKTGRVTNSNAKDGRRVPHRGPGGKQRPGSDQAISSCVASFEIEFLIDRDFSPFLPVLLFH